MTMTMTMTTLSVVASPLSGMTSRKRQKIPLSYTVIQKSKLISLK